MKYLQKIWVRILLSLIAGGMLAEIVHIRFGEISHQTSSFVLWIGAGITFGILSLIVWFYKYRYYFFPPKDKNEDVLDDID